MTDKEEMIPLKDAIQQVKTAVTRLALMHLGFSKTLVEELGEKKAKELIIKSMVEYGKLIGEEIPITVSMGNMYMMIMTI